MHIIKNQDLYKISGGDISNLTRQNYNQSVYNNVVDPPRPVPAYNHTFFLNENKLDIQVDFNTQRQIGLDNSILDPKIIDMQAYTNHKIILRKSCIFYLDMNYKRFDMDIMNNTLQNIGTLYEQQLAPSLLSKGRYFKNQSLPILMKFYFNISNVNSYKDDTKFYENITDPKLQKKMDNYYSKVIKKHINNIFLEYFNSINNTEFYRRKNRTPLKVHQLDGSDIQLHYDTGSRKITTNDLNIKYDIRADYYYNTNLFTITLPLSNLYDYIDTSYNYLLQNDITNIRLRYILFSSYFHSQYDQSVENYKLLLTQLIDKVIVVQDIRTTNGSKYKLIHLNPNRHTPNHNNRLELFETRIQTYNLNHYIPINRIQAILIPNISLMLINYNLYPKIEIESFYITIISNLHNENNNNNQFNNVIVNRTLPEQQEDEEDEDEL